MSSKKGNYKVLIIIISVIVPVLVAILIFIPGKKVSGSALTAFLPHLNSIINMATSLILVAGLIFIRNGKKEWHKTAMLSAFALGCIFLISYIVYHSTSPSTVFGDMDHDGILSDSELSVVGTSRTIYLLILLSHIVLAAIVVPFVLFALFYALSGRFDKHKRVVRFTYPIWLYVSISGVIVYFMISQYY